MKLSKKKEYCLLFFDSFFNMTISMILLSSKKSHSKTIKKHIRNLKKELRYFHELLIKDMGN